MSMGNRPSFSREAQLQWAGSRETNLASGRGRTFFLTSLFIELIENCPSGSMSEIAIFRQLSTCFRVVAHRKLPRSPFLANFRFADDPDRIVALGCK